MSITSFGNCDNHSINLEGVHSAKQNPAVVTIFGTFENIYSFFTRSTIRWEELRRVGILFLEKLIVYRTAKHSTMNFKETATDIESLEQKLVGLRNYLSQKIVVYFLYQITSGVQVDRRIRQRKRMPGN